MLAGSNGQGEHVTPLHAKFVEEPSIIDGNADLCGLGAAVVGSTLGVSRKQRLAATTPPEADVTHHPAHST